MKKTFKIIIIIIAIIVAIAVISFLVNKNKPTEDYVTSQVIRGNLIQTVSEVGTVKANQEIDLSFLQGGKLASILVKVGDNVLKDQILADLDYSSLTIKKDEAQANLEVAQANLNKLLAGATKEEIAVSQANVQKAKVNYEAAQNDLAKTQELVEENNTQAQKKLDDLQSKGAFSVTPQEQAVTTAETNLNNIKDTYQQAVNNKRDAALTTLDSKLTLATTALDNIRTILEDDEAEGFLGAKNSSYLPLTTNERINSLSFLQIAQDSLIEAENNLDNESIDKALNDGIICLNSVFSSLDYCYKLLENTTVSPNFTQTELDAYKTTISTQLTAITNSITSVQTAKQNFLDAILNYNTNIASAQDQLTQALVNLSDAITTAKNNVSSTAINGDKQITAAQSAVSNAYETWQLSKSQLDELKSPARVQDISLSQAQVKQAEAALSLIEKQIDDSHLKAPIAGRVVDISYEIGEQVVSNAPVITILAENIFKIEVDISEADISKISLGNESSITLDAFGEELKFAGQVYFIEPAETIIQDVIYYRVTVNFADNELFQQYKDKIKSGMTANLSIITNKKENVLQMPSRAIIEKNGSGKFVKILKNEAVEELPVKVGLRGDEGMVEIISGVLEDDEVITYIKEKK